MHAHNHMYFNARYKISPWRTYEHPCHKILSNIWTPHTQTHMPSLYLCRHISFVQKRLFSSSFSRSSVQKTHNENRVAAPKQNKLQSIFNLMSSVRMCVERQRISWKKFDRHEKARATWTAAAAVASVAMHKTFYGACQKQQYLYICLYSIFGFCFSEEREKICMRSTRKCTSVLCIFHYSMHIDKWKETAYGINLFSCSNSQCCVKKDRIKVLLLLLMFKVKIKCMQIRLGFWWNAQCTAHSQTSTHEAVKLQNNAANNSSKKWNGMKWNTWKHSNIYLCLYL